MNSILSKEKDFFLVFLFLLTVFIFFQSYSVYGGDSGDLISAMAVRGFAHPPGYPLFSLLGALLIKIIPFGTPAWKAGFLSSVPSVLALSFLYQLIKKLYNQKIAGSTALTIAFIYPVFFYSSVAEVFSLNTFFTIILLYFLYSFRSGREIKYLSLFFFFFGLSLTHHHIILFSVPAYYYLLRKDFNSVKENWKKYLLLFILGLTPYLYLPLSSLINNSLYFWGEAYKPAEFLKILTRSSYGTFKSFGSAANLPVQRLVGMLIFIKYIGIQLKIFTGAIFALGLIGYVVKFKHKQKELKYEFLTAFFILFFSYSFLIFYASFPAINDLLMATVERFYIIPIILLSLFIAHGLELIFKITQKLKHFNKLGKAIFLIILFISPIIMFVNNFYKVSVIKKDFTAENFANDLLKNTPQDSILILPADTPYFNTEYVHYALSVRPDIILLGSTLSSPEYLEKLSSKKQVNVNRITDSDNPYREFIRNNLDKHIFIGRTFSVQDTVQVPEGLLLKYYPDDATPSAGKVFETNKELFSTYQDFSKSSLEKYQNLYLNDVKNHYLYAMQRLAEYFIDQKEFEYSLYFINLYQQFSDNDNYNILIYKGEVSLVRNECETAEKSFLKAKEINPSSLLPDAFLKETYSNCFHDEEKASQYLESCLSGQ